MKRKQYTPQDLARAVALVQGGSTLKQASDQCGVPVATLGYRAKMAKRGIEPRRPGPKPAIPSFIEDDFVDWVGMRQAKGHPPTRRELLIRTNAATRLVQGESLTRHWTRRFLERHPELADRTSQTISRARTSVTAEDMDVFYTTLVECFA